MKKSTTILVVAAACGLVCASIAIVTPKVVKAAVAILVRDEDNPARHPFLAHCDSGGTQFSENECVLPVVPAGQELVIETASFQMTADASKSFLRPTVRVVSSKVDQFIPLNTFFDDGSAQPNAANFRAVMPLRFYADPGASIVCIGNTAGNNPSFGLFVTCTLSGYFVSLP